MTKAGDIKSLIMNGENSTVEFKEEKAHNDSIAKELIAFLNFKGGCILFGVSDEGNILGISDKNFEERIMNIFYTKIFPTVIPEYEEIEIEGKKISVVKVDRGIDKPYYTKINGKNCYFVRYGSTSREAYREELLRLFQASGNIHYEVSPTLNASIKDLDMNQVEEYFLQYRSINMDNLTQAEKEKVLVNTEILSEAGGSLVPTTAGLLLFGKNPKKYLTSAGIRAMHLAGNDLSDKVIDHKFFEKDIFTNIENALEYLKLRMNEGFDVEERGKRIDKKEYPIKVLRELLVNAFVHRDYTITGSNIAVIVYDDRIQIKSPGSIPNSLTVEKIKQGMMYHRNPVLVQFLYDAGYVERLGRGVRNSVESMKKYNGTDIKILSDEVETSVTVYK